MLTEKQIYNRLNKVYEAEFGDRAEDEWYGDDDPRVWRFYRPSQATTYKMLLDEERRRVNLYYKKDNQEYRFCGCHSY